MTEQERYLFDLQGYLAVPNALDVSQLEALNALLDSHINAETTEEMQSHRFGGLLTWGKPYLDLVDNPRITPYLSGLLGENFRLDHDYADLIRTGLSPIGATLHGGATPFDPSQYYRFEGGHMYNGLTVVAYNLRDVNAGDGGFACVPGSHKSNYRFPSEWRNLETMQSFVKPVVGPAGTAIIFTEALTHGPLPWRGDHERRTIFYKYSPAPLSWSSRYYNAEDYPEISEQQASLLNPPSARYSR